MQKYTVLLLVGKHYSKNFLFAHFTNFWFILSIEMFMIVMNGYWLC